MHRLVCARPLLFCVGIRGYRGYRCYRVDWGLSWHLATTDPMAALLWSGGGLVEGEKFVFFLFQGLDEGDDFCDGFG